MRPPLFSLLVLAGSTLVAAPYVSVTCGSPVGLPVSTNSTETSSSCSSLTGGGSYYGASNSDFRNGGSTASGQVVLTLASDPANYSLLSTFQSAQAVQANPAAVEGSILGRGTSAQIEIAYSSLITTLGPERQGYLQISPESSGIGARPYSGGFGMTSGLEINPIGSSPYDPTRPVTEVHCDSDGQCNPSGPYLLNHYPLIPVTLGVPITVLANGQANDYVDSGYGSSGGSLTTTFGFRFFEADELTPVTVVTATPEPSTWVSMAGGLAAIVFLRQRRRV